MSQRFSPGWAVGWWFIPFMNCFRPYQVMNEIWKSSHPNNKYTPGLPSAGTYKIDIGSNLIGWWWALWIVSENVGFAILRIQLRTEDTKDLIEILYWDMLVTSLAVISAVIVFILINQITNNQEMKSQSSVNWFDWWRVHATKKIWITEATEIPQYSPTQARGDSMVGGTRVELVTSAMSTQRSKPLS